MISWNGRINPALLITVFFIRLPRAPPCGACGLGGIQEGVLQFLALGTPKAAALETVSGGAKAAALEMVSGGPKAVALEMVSGATRLGTRTGTCAAFAGGRTRTGTCAAFARGGTRTGAFVGRGNGAATFNPLGIPGVEATACA